MTDFVLLNRHKGRFIIIFGLLLAIVMVLGGRLANLHVYEQKFLRDQGKARTVRLAKIPAYRGMITDRLGEPLAVSTPVESVWMNPQSIDVTHPQLATVAKLLEIAPQALQDKINRYASREFIYLKRHLTPALAKQVLALKVPGIYSQSEFKRFYPSGEVTTQLLGVTDIDDLGQEGLELAFDQWLRGKEGRRQIIRDRLGREVEYIAHLDEMRPGGNLQLSIDQRLQYVAYRTLVDAIEEHNAVSGSVVILDVHTGEVLSMVNAPSFNPNNREQFNQTLFRNRAAIDIFEPASAIKAFSLASVLENSTVTADTVVDTSPGILNLRGGVVRDLQNYGRINVSTIMQRSSNIGITKLVLAQPPVELFDTYQKLGFGEYTGSGFPGESMGILNVPGDDQPFVVATMAFGYGLAVTPLQLARAYTILGNGGIKRPVSFVKLDTPPAGERVIDEHVARQVVSLLTDAVEYSHLSRAKVPGYLVAGKTGTARKLGHDGYEKGKHRAVFGGLAPAINPQFAIVVTINEPRKGQYYSNLVAAPVFSKIASHALRLFNVPPDLLQTQGVHIAQNGSHHS